MKVTNRNTESKLFILRQKEGKCILNNLISNAIKYKDVSKEESFVTVLLNAIVKTQLSL
jgi:hypothetical protein